MHTVIVIASGLILLAVTLLLGRWLGSSVPLAVQVFIGLWLIIALGNMWFGVSRAGYSVRDELPMFLLVFGAPALIAVWVWFKHTGS